MRGRDKDGPYYRWGPSGHHGKKYHYISKDKESRDIARKKAMRQARAIEWSKHSKGR